MSTHWKVSEVARLAHVTVRTLHHYDEIGLLRPSGRTPTGHRLYGRAELERWCTPEGIVAMRVDEEGEARNVRAKAMVSASTTGLTAPMAARQ